MGYGFKELAFRDINIFLNPEEFGEYHVIDGKRMSVVVDGLEVVERSKKQVEKGRIDGIYEKQILIYVARSEFGSLPAIGRALKLDNSIYRVEDAIDEGGIYSITLGAAKA
ncbi:MAG: hypothetical protein HFG49_08375 [Lachnospiraceae bacterium]|jgi:hypothetical protein|nr:hypothetical protein [Lachnospiraceae bacterium]